MVPTNRYSSPIGGKAQRFAPRWSADGSRIAFRDKDGRSYVVTVADRSLQEIAKDVHGRMFDYTWSPTGNTLAWSMTDSDKVSLSIFTWSADDPKVRRVTTAVFNEYTRRGIRTATILYISSDRDYSAAALAARVQLRRGADRPACTRSLCEGCEESFPMESDEVSIDSAARAPAPPAAAPAAGGPPQRRDCSE
jgi:tricorn protease